MDPQERLFLETAWKTMEVAGYSREMLSGKQVGVFVGVTYGEYQLFGAEESLKGHRIATNPFYASIANRVSYYLNIQGPSIAVDTMCSSSLTAIHMAMVSLRESECELAIAGGVNLSIHPSKYLMLSQGKFLASDGLCRSFGEGGDGYVPGEGIGAVLLKPLERALEEGDRIYGIIKGSSINHGGKTNGYSVPNPNAQATLVEKAIQNAGITAESISYIEAHGTGTSLGDPIEIAGLSKAFGESKGNPCAIGSVKSNIGHLESAAGIAGLTKILLQMQYKTLVPSLHATALNPNINFAETPFQVQRTLEEWKRPMIVENGISREGMRRAGISSFGAGGSNAHLIIEEGPEYIVSTKQNKPYYLLSFSAKHVESLQQRLEDFRLYLEKHPALPLEAIAYTLNVGRSHFDERAAFVVSSVEELKEKLGQLQKNIKPAGYFKGDSKQTEEDAAIHKQVLENSFDKLKTSNIQESNRYKELLEALASLYVKGYELDWVLLHQNEAQQRIYLPSYPFLKERHWIAQVQNTNISQNSAVQRLHPLIDANISTIEGQKFETHLRVEEFYLNDHRVNDEPVFPAAAYLEMARAAGEMGSTDNRVVALKNVIWSKTIHFSDSEHKSKKIKINLHPNALNVDFKINTMFEKTLNDSVEPIITHSEGQIVYSSSDTLPSLRTVEMQAIKQRCVDYKSPDDIYAEFNAMGLNYGPAFRTIVGLWHNKKEVLAHLELPKSVQDKAEDFFLHPSLLDGALQAIIGISGEQGLLLPFSMGEVKIYRPIRSLCYAYVTKTEGIVNKFHVQVIDELGHVLVDMEDFVVRAVSQKKGEASLQYYQASWVPRAMNGYLPLPETLLVINASKALLQKIEQCNTKKIKLVEVNPSEDYETRFRSLNEQGTLPRTILYINSIQSVSEEAFQRIYFELLRLNQVLIDLKLKQEFEILFVNEGSVEVRSLLTGAIASFAKTLQLEQPNILCRVLEIEDVKRDIQVILNELGQRSREVRFNEGRREVKVYESFNPVAETAKTLRNEGCYLITGGLGGLGVIFAKYLARQCQAKLVLTGRSEVSELTEIQKQTLKVLEQLGSKVLYIKADVSNRAEVERLLDETHAKVGPLHGIIHAAGFIKDAFIMNKKPHDAALVLAPKVAGILNIDELTQSEPLDFVILFSSITSILGNVGQSDYAYANGFMDGYSVYRNHLVRQKLRNGKTISINWPLWSEGGMQVDDSIVKAMEYNWGALPLPTSYGIEALNQVLQQNNAQQIIGFGYNTKFKQAFEKLGELKEISKITADKIAGKMAIPLNKTELQEKTENYLKKILSEIIKLPVERLEENKPLEMFGVDSVMRMQFNRRVVKDFSGLTEISLFEHQTLKDLASYLCLHYCDRLEELLTNHSTLIELQTAIDTNPINDFMHPSTGQERIWFLHALNPEIPMYNIGISIALKGALNKKFLLQACQLVINRHESLRMIFPQENGKITIKIKEEIDAKIELINCLERTQIEGLEKTVEEVFQQTLDKTFDLEQGPLIRHALLSCQTDLHVFIVIMHHIISDGWSLGLYLKELAEYYQLLSKQLPLPQTLVKTYSDFLKEGRNSLDKNSQAKILNYWMKELADLSPLNLPTDKSRSQNKSIARCHKVNFPKDLSNKLKQLSQEKGTTLFSVLFSTYYLMLAKYSGDKNFAIAVPTHGRSNEDWDGVIGFFVNILPIKPDIYQHMKFSDLITQLSTKMKNALIHQKVPFSELISKLNLNHSQNETPLFQVMFTLQNYPMSAPYFGDLSVENMNSESGRTAYDLALDVHSYFEDFRVYLKYDPNIFVEETIIRLSSYWLELLNNMIQNFEQPIDSLSILPAAEYKKLLVDWTDTDKEYPSNKTIPQLFEEQAESKPNNTAIVYEKVQLSYRELNEQANQLAHYLIDNYKIQPDNLIALVLDRNEHMIIAILAVLKSGAAYVPIASDFPDERIQYILEDTATKIVITNQAYEKRIQKISSAIEVLSIDSKQIEQFLSSYSTENTNPKTTMRHLAYVIYTSGTTGKPKGTLIEHIGAINLKFDLTSRYKLGADDNKEVFLMFADYVFDVSVEQILLSLLNGYTLALIPKELYFDKDKFYHYLNSKEVTHIEATPTFCEQYDFGKVLSLKRLVLGGEQVTKECRDKLFGGVKKLINSYGPTEVTITSVVNIMEDDNLAIGYPISNIKCYVLDADLRPLPIGGVGELYMGGIAVARGYLNQRALTEERFIANPFQTEQEKLQNKNDRLYKTGDLVRWLNNGKLEYIGRNDFQVKIRGYRIELGEIETALSSYPGVVQSVVLAKEARDTKSKHLVGYYVSDHPLEAESLLSYLQHQLPEYMIPTALMHMKSFPLTISGKLDRKALPDPKLNDQKNYVPPRNEFEAQIVEILAEILRLDPNTVGIQDDFIRLGGDSIISIQLVSRIRQKLGITLAVKDIFNYKTIEKICEHIKNLDADSVPVFQKHKETLSENNYAVANRTQERLQTSKEIEGIYLANSLQQGFIFHALNQGERDDAYVVQIIWEYHTAINVDLLNEAWSYAQKRYGSLRLRFDWEEDLVQIIEKEANVDWRYIDLSRDERAVQESKLFNIQKEDRLEPYKLNKGSLFRVYLIKQHEKLYTCIFSNHHAILDGWSNSILLFYVHDIYTKLLSKQSITLSINSSYEHAQIFNQSHKSEHQSYWNGYLSIVQEHTELNGLLSDKNKNLRINEYKHIQKPAEEILEISGNLYKNLKKLSHEEGVTLNAVLQFIWHKVLNIFGNSPQTVVGTTVSGRNLPINDIENAVGLFINTLPLVVEHNASKTIIDTIKTIQSDLHEINSRSQIDLSSLQKKGTRLFDSLFVYENYPMSMVEDSFNELSLVFKKVIQKLDYPLCVIVYETKDKLNFSLNYAGELFNQKTVQYLLSIISNLLEQVTANPYQMPKNLKYLTKEQYYQVITEWNQTDKEYSIEKTIHQLFEDQVQVTPDNIAVIYDETHLSYRELNAEANKLAHYLIENYNVQADNRIAVYLDRSEHMLVAILAVLKAGGAYVPIAPDYPDERIQYILRDTGAKVVLTNQIYEQKLKDLSTLAIILAIDSKHAKKLLEQYSVENPKTSTSSNHLAYVIYTSGTTGNPKGVMIEHRGIVNRIQWMNNKYPLQESDKILQKTPYVFDVSVWELFWAHWFGACIVFMKPEEHKNANSILEIINKKSITIIHFVPSMLNVFQESLKKGKDNLPSLKYIFCSGEALTLTQVKKVRYLLPGAEIHNLYGPTEVSVDVLYYDCNDKDIDIVYIGKPISNTRIYILDSHLNPVPIGAVGELYIGGVGLARGYLNKPELTEERFINNPFQIEIEREQNRNAKLYKTGDLVRYSDDGYVEYLGRNDFQVKIRGYRIELGEIEGVLLTYEGVKEAVVLPINLHNSNELYLVGYYVSEYSLNTEELLDHLRQKLPEYMIPTMLTHLERLPLNINGKLDRKLLPKPEFAIQENYIAPRNELESRISQLWSEVLGYDLDKIGVNDDFFQLGGNSILAIRILNKINTCYNACLKLSDVYSDRTIAKLLSKIVQTKNNYQTIVKLNNTYEKPNMFMIHPGLGGCDVYFDLANKLVDKFSCYGIDSYNLYNKNKIEDIFQLSGYYLSSIKEIMLKTKQDEYHILGWSLGGQIALTIASLLEREGNRKIKVYLLDTLLDYERNLEETNLELNCILNEMALQGFGDDYIKKVEISYEVESKIAKQKVNSKLSYTKIILFKALLQDPRFKQDIFDRYYPEKHHSNFNNIDKIIKDKSNIKLVELPEAHHWNILTQVELLISEIEFFSKIALPLSRPQNQLHKKQKGKKNLVKV